LAYTIVVGKRKVPHDGKPHNMTNIFLGTAILWFGWFGFNGGSAFQSSGRASMASLVTTLCASSAAITWTVFDYFYSNNGKKLSGLSFCCGAISGLILVTPMSGYIEPWAAVVSGIIGGIVINLSGKLKRIFGFDDALDAFSIHGMSGVVGNLLCGIFSRKAISYANSNISQGGAIDGNWNQLKYNAIATVAEAAYSFFVSLLILLIINRIPGLHLRCSAEEELIGNDLSEMGEACYGKREFLILYACICMLCLTNDSFFSSFPNRSNGRQHFLHLRQ
jgi:Amt family ammonium transporter